MVSGWSTFNAFVRTHVVSRSGYHGSARPKGEEINLWGHEKINGEVTKVKLVFTRFLL